MTLGIDMVDVARLRTALARSPRLEERLFTKAERKYCTSKPDPAVHFGGTLAAKEAVIKALKLGRLVEWCGRIEISRGTSGEPGAAIDGGPATVEVSISHERDMAVAVAMVAADRAP
jgi:holo-[acyl-carrier protein] synthase